MEPKVLIFGSGRIRIKDFPKMKYFVIRSESFDKVFTREGYKCHHSSKQALITRKDLFLLN